MSAAVAYDPKLLQVRRWTAAPSTLDEFLIGNSVLGSTGSSYTIVPAATVTFTSGYTPDEHGTLIIDAETVAISLSFWDEVPASAAIYPGNRCEILYAGKRIVMTTIDSVSITYSADPEAAKHGATRRVDFTASGAGTYAVMMGRTVSWVSLPKETAIHRIRRWVTVNGF